MYRDTMDLWVRLMLPSPGISVTGYHQLAEFRHRIREFLHFSEQAARDNGIEPQQHQLLLAIKGLPEGLRPTISVLSSRLYLKHHSTVELIDRLVERGAAARHHAEDDRREVLVTLTPLGEELLRKLSFLHWQELQTSGPELCKALQTIVET
jgi:DNA-binding MarR family transcriptional regulator